MLLQVCGEAGRHALICVNGARNEPRLARTIGAPPTAALAPSPALSSSLSSAALRAANRRGIAAMLLSAVSFVANDAMLKYVSQSLPGPQAIFLRGVFAMLFLLVLAHVLGATRQIARVRDRRVVARSVLDASATCLYLTALFHLPLGNATAINMAAPLFITLFAVLVLREPVNRARWLALGAGFAGVLLIVQPAAEGFNAWAILCVAGTLLHSGRDLLTRFIDRSIPSVLLTLTTATSVTLLSGVLSLFGEWRPVGAPQWALLAASSVFLSIAHYFLIISMRAGEVSLIAPFRYSGLLFALLVGFVVWSDVPNALAWAGIVLLVGAGLYVLHNERARQREMVEAASVD